MRMKKFSKFFMSMLAMCTIAACSNDELGNKPVVDPGASTDAVYMNVTVQLPTGPGTRSETDTPSNGDYGTSTGGTEVGHQYENDVKTVMLVLTDRKNRLIAYGTHQNVTKNGDVVSSTQKISKSELLTYYGEDKTLNTIQQDGENYNEWEIYVYVFCNPTTDLKDKLASATKGSADWINAIYEISDRKDDVVWGGADKKQGFLMSSAVLVDCKKNLPRDFDEWKNYDAEGKAFDLSGVNKSGQPGEVNNEGNIRVERSVARFDFKDGSTIGNNTYDVLVEEPTTAGEEKKVGMQIQLTKMALVNMSKHFYYLRRVSDDGLPTGNNFEICGTERKDNYVVDTDATQKNVTKVDAGYPFGTYFEYCLGTVSDETWTINDQTRTQWDTYDIKDVLDTKKENDKDETWNNDKTKGDYKIWRYVTENTIPGIAAQKHGVSTGIVFKGKMVATDNSSPSVKAAIDGAKGDPAGDKILYSIFNDLYVTWIEVRNKAIDLGESHDLYKAAFGNAKNTPAKVSEGIYDVDKYSDDPTSPDALWRTWKEAGSLKDNNLSAFKEAAIKSQFTLYQSSNDDKYGPGYYCYYYYWNRHDNNGKPGEMGAMEFAVVRNNVYKLAVTKINRLGHPRLSENDPDPEDPDNPDESDDVYMKVNVEVLPWVVRINDIEF